MAGVYSPRHPERIVLYRVLFHYFDRFLTEYESRLEREYGYFRPIIKDVVERYLDCGNPRCGFARICCPDCRQERLVMFSCRTRGFCPSCHAKRIEEWGEWMRETLLLDVAHRQIVFTIPKRLRVFFKFNRRLLGNLCRCAVRALTRYFEVIAFLVEYAVLDRIIGHLEMTFVAERPPASESLSGSLDGRRGPG